MACIIHTNLYEDKILIKMQKDLTKHIEIGNKQYGTSQSKTIHMYSVDETVKSRPCKIPFSYGLKLPSILNIEVDRPHRKTLGTIQHKFEGNLRDEQKDCRNKALDKLQTHKCLMLSCFTGFGKTVTAINMASKIKLKTFIVVPKKPLLNQWKLEIEKFLPQATTLIIDPSKLKFNLEDVPDFCICNACNLHKIDKNFLKHYGFVIVDEAHLQMTEKLSENLLYLTPRYLLGITATPYREDGYNQLFNLFFGDEKVSFALNKKHIVYKVKTGFVPNKDKYLKYGPMYKQKIDWNNILDEQSKDEERNKIILNIITKFKDRIFLILVKRVEHGEYLIQNLKELGESVTSLLGKQQTFDKEARILIGTNSKIGTGFDHPKLDTLLCACDMLSYYIQFIGRVMRRKDVEPIIFDLVDSHPILRKHFEKRSKVYTKHGGEITKYQKND
jgi:superfamily II DNA or RNA helicase